LFTYGLGGLAIVFAPNFAAVLTLRFCQGVAMSTLMIVILTLISDVYEGTERNAVMGVNSGATTFGATIYPILGGQLAEVSWRAPFAFYAISIVVAIFTFRSFEEPEINSIGQSSLTIVFRKLFAPQIILLYTSLGVLFIVLIGGIYTALPFILERGYTLSTGTIGLILVTHQIVGTLVALLNGYLDEYLSTTMFLFIGTILCGLGLAILPGAPNVLTIIGLLIIFGIGMGLLLPTINVGISKLSTSKNVSVLFGVRMSVKRFGQTVGPVAFTLVSTPSGYRSSLVIGGVVIGLLGIVIFVINRN
jgi:MFS family permease